MAKNKNLDQTKMSLDKTKDLELQEHEGELESKTDTMLKENSRRDFFKKSMLFSTAAVVSLGGVPTKANAKYVANPDNLPPNNPAWGLKWGRDTNHSPYGTPSKYDW